MLEISFAPTGWGCIYYFGIIKALRQNLSSEYIRNNIKITCSSSGVFAGLGLLLNSYSVNEFIILYDTLLHKYSNHIIGRGNELVIDVLNSIIPQDVYLELLNHKLYINYCTFENFKIKYHTVSYFNSREELINYLLASCYIPFYSGKQHYINNEKVYDGFFYEQMPTFSKDTICFCPFPFEKSDKDKKIMRHCNFDFNPFFPIKDKDYNNKLLKQGYYCGIFAFINYIQHSVN